MTQPAHEHGDACAQFRARVSAAIAREVDEALDEILAENTRLRAEVDQLRAEVNHLRCQDGSW